MRQYMDFVLVREDYSRAKPDPEPYLTALNQFGAPKEEALVVEDSARGLRSAIEAGVDCAIVYNEFTKSQDFSQAHYRIRTLAELNEIILGSSLGAPSQRGPIPRSGLDRRHAPPEIRKHEK